FVNIAATHFSFLNIRITPLTTRHFSGRENRFSITFRLHSNSFILNKLHMAKERFRRRRWQMLSVVALLSIVFISWEKKDPGLEIPIPYYRLSNDLKVFPQQNRTSPTTVVEVNNTIAFPNDQRNRKGSANLFEHILFQESGTSARWNSS